MRLPTYKLKTFTIPFLVVAAAGVLAAPADTLRESYTAVLSERDHLNSSGGRLNNAAAIIRQDRANFHKFDKRDEGDQSDKFFASAENREKLEQLLKRGKSEPSALTRIINGTPTVTINIYQDESGRDYVNVIVNGGGGGGGGDGDGLRVAEAGDESDLLETYTAVLSERDHLNSSGGRLNNAAAIIRQDRANFHKFNKRDEGDQSDKFFASAENREKLEQLLNRGQVNKATMRTIVDNPTVVTVHVYRSASGENYIKVYIGE